MAENNKLRVITCVICTKFCQNQDEGRINGLIESVKAEGFRPVFSCDFLKNYFAGK